MSFESESINENVFFVKGNVHCFGNPRRKRILFALDKFRKLDLRFEKNKERLIDGLVKAIIECKNTLQELWGCVRNAAPC